MAYDDPPKKQPQASSPHDERLLTTQDGFRSPSSTYSGTQHSTVFTPQSSVAHPNADDNTHLPHDAPPAYSPSSGAPVTPSVQYEQPRFNHPLSPSQKPAAASGGPPFAQGQAPAPSNQYFQQQRVPQQQQQQQQQRQQQQQQSQPTQSRHIPDNNTANNGYGSLPPRRRDGEGRIVRGGELGGLRHSKNCCVMLCRACLVIPTAILAALVAIISALCCLERERGMPSLA